MAITISGSGITSANIADGTITTDDILASDVKSLKSGRKNLLINGGFDVWQRGTSFTGGDAYVADRWSNQVSGASVNITQQSFTLGQTDVPNNPKYYLKWEVTAGNDNSRITQKIENVSTLTGETVTLSYWAKHSSGTLPTGIKSSLRQEFGSGGSPSSTVYVPSGNISLSSSWQKFTHTFTLPSVSGKTLGTAGNDYLGVALGWQVGTETSAYTIDIAQVQLELGSVATDFEHRSYGEELALCQRYYWKLQSEGTAYTYLTLGGNFVSGSHFITSISFPTEMRIAPTGSHNLQTLSISTATGAGNINFYFQNQGQHTAAGTGTFNNYNLATFRTYANGGAYYISPASISSTHLRFGSNGYIQFDAEL
jgi:hypothetical protein